MKKNNFGIGKGMLLESSRLDPTDFGNVKYDILDIKTHGVFIKNLSKSIYPDCSVSFICNQDLPEFFKENGIEEINPEEK